MAGREKHSLEESPQDDELLTYREAGRLLGLPMGTLYERVARRLIPHVRLGRRLVRFEKKALEAWLRDRRVPVVADGD